MKKPWIPDVLKAAVILACIGWFSLLLPEILGQFLLAWLPPSARYSSQWEALGFEFGIGLFFMGVPLGIHVGMLLTQRTLWLRCEFSRSVFTALSGLCAIVATVLNLTDGDCTRSFSLSFRWIYFLAVQVLPLLWFAYNLNGGIVRIMLAHRRHHLAKG